MYLKQLTLRGFKSFAKPTTFTFEPGVTAVVGPNGSGKSNVVDALAWVMGEQGVKALRGGKMEDVIFAGTSTRGPLGRAEVQLTIDNSDGALPIDYTEVTISRTLFRNGSSEYAINGEGCRLLDVQELLSDTGLGREMHVIVGQGQLDAVLRATPEDRRGFIEEAAGILKHRRRKEKTLRKLEAMQGNLTRLNDLAGELRRQLKPLGRQAEVARAAQGIAAEARDAKARIAADDISTLRAELSLLTRNASERGRNRDFLLERQQRTHAQLLVAESAQAGDRVDPARRVTLELESVQGKLRGLFAQANQRLTFLATQAVSPETTGRLGKAAVDAALREQRELAVRLPEAERAFVSVAERTASVRAARDRLDEELSQQSALVSQYDLRLSQLRGNAEASAHKQATSRGQLQREEQAVEQAAARLLIARAAYDTFVEESGAPADQKESLEQEHELATEELRDAEQAAEAARTALEQAAREHVGLAAQVSALTLALHRPDASDAILRDGSSGILGPVAESLRVRAGYEAAIATALGPLGEAVLAESRESGFAALSRAQAGALGSLHLIISHGRTAELPPSIPGLTPAISLIEGPAGVLGTLAHTYIAPDLAAVRTAQPALAAAFPAGGYTVVTQAGELVTEFVLQGGSGGGASHLELLAERDRMSKAEESAHLGLQEAQASYELLREAVRAAQQRSGHLLQQLRDQDARAAALSGQLSRLQQSSEAAEADAARLQARLEESREAVLEADVVATQAAAELQEATALPRPRLDTSARARVTAELEAARNDEVEERLRLETARERVRASAERAQAIADQVVAEERAAEEAARRSVLRQRQVDRATRVAQALPALLSSVDASLADARLAQLAAEQERAQNNQEVVLLRAEEAEQRELLRGLTEEVHQAELTSYERTVAVTALVERAQSELGLAEVVLLAEYGPEQPVPVIPRILPQTERSADADADADADVDAESGQPGVASESSSGPGSAGEASGPAQAELGGVEGASVPYVRAEQEQRLARAERKLRELGRVNPLALEEFAALEQRHAFLVEQLSDLTKTRQDLLVIISDLDSKMESIFAAAYADTEEAFAEVFPMLFPGGTGEIVLTDPHNLLTTGIEMTVRPAGKKVERLSLLSGGERSLAAVAWLIAIFMARPSPFYIMDEVEAALDDANLGRLLRVFETLRERSQLIVITHQKRTMEIADALYGVSMQQDGISTVIGQRIGREAGTESRDQTAH